MKIAGKTHDLIENSIARDGGTSFRKALQTLLPKMEDAYRESGERFRSHFGYSSAGDACARKLWYSWRWVKAPEFPPKILRLFNRGHLEEARFLAMLESAKIQTWYETEDGGQFRIQDHNGHAGSALDGVVKGLPELPKDTPALVEMKTHNMNQFTKLKSKGVRSSHWKHYIQMQIYMRKMNLYYALYMAVNKNNEELHLEIVELDKEIADRFIERAGVIIYAEEAPDRVNESASFFDCKYCDYRMVCHGFQVPEINCRTCISSNPMGDGTWFCTRYGKELGKQDQLTGCQSHVFHPALLNGAMVVKDRVDDEGYLRIQWRDQLMNLGESETEHCSSSMELIEAYNV